MIQSVPEASGASKRHVRYSQIANDASGRGEATAPRHWPKTLAKNIGPKQTGARAVSARAPLYTRRSAPASAVEQTRGRVRSNRPAVPAAAGAASLSPPRLTPTAGASRGGQRRSPSSVLHHRLRAPPSGLSGIRGGPEPAVPARTTLNAWRRPKTGCVRLSLSSDSARTRTHRTQGTNLADCSAFAHWNGTGFGTCGRMSAMEKTSGKRSCFAVACAPGRFCVSRSPPPALCFRARVRFCSPAGPSWLERPRTPNSSLAGGDQFPLRARFFAGASFGLRVEKRPKIARKAGNIGGAGGSGCAPAGVERIERLKMMA